MYQRLVGATKISSSYQRELPDPHRCFSLIVRSFGGFLEANITIRRLKFSFVIIGFIFCQGEFPNQVSGLGISGNYYLSAYLFSGS